MVTPPERANPSGPNLLCVLPDEYIVVRIYAAHGCDGIYCADAWCYGPSGRIGRCLL